MTNIQHKSVNKLVFFHEWIFIIGMLFILPFVFTQATIDPVLSIRLFILSILLLVLSLLEIFCVIKRRNPLVIQRRIIWVPLLCYLLFSVFSLTNASNVYEGIPEIFKILMFMIVLFMSSSIFSSAYSNYEYLETTINVPQNTWLNISFAHKGYNDGEGYYYINNSQYLVWGSNYYGNSWNSYQDSYYTGSNTQITLHSQYSTESYGQGYLDNIQVTW